MTAAEKEIQELRDELNVDVDFDRELEIRDRIRELEIEIGLRSGHVITCDDDFCESCGS